MDTQLKISIAAGGTAGHINPALALAEELNSRGHDVSFVGQLTRLEGTLVPECGFPFIPIEVAGFDRSKPWSILKALRLMKKAQRELARHYAKQGKPDICVGFGAYVELPLMNYCIKNNIPYLLHEQNSVPGLANLTLSKHAQEVACSFPEAVEKFKKYADKTTKLSVTGNPVRTSVTQASRKDGRKSFGIAEDKTVLLVFGGSLGARHLNQAILELQDELLKREDLYVVHATGKDEYEACKDLLKGDNESTKRWKLISYISNMGEALAAADLVVSRAGASSIAEIAAVALPSVLVPYPHATEDHQTTNAKLLCDCGAAKLVHDAQLDSPIFKDTLFSLLNSPDELNAMREAASGLKSKNAAHVLADHVESIASI